MGEEDLSVGLCPEQEPSRMAADDFVFACGAVRWAQAGPVTRDFRLAKNVKRARQGSIHAVRTVLYVGISMHVGV